MHNAERFATPLAPRLWPWRPQTAVTWWRKRACPLAGAGHNAQRHGYTTITDNTWAFRQPGTHRCVLGRCRGCGDQGPGDWRLCERLHAEIYLARALHVRRAPENRVTRCMRGRRATVYATSWCGPTRVPLQPATALISPLLKRDFLQVCFTRHTPAVATLF